MSQHVASLEVSFSTLNTLKKTRICPRRIRYISAWSGWVVLWLQDLPAVGSFAGLLQSPHVLVLWTCWRRRLSASRHPRPCPASQPAQRLAYTCVPTTGTPRSMCGQPREAWLAGGYWCWQVRRRGRGRREWKGRRRGETRAGEGVPLIIFSPAPVLSCPTWEQHCLRGAHRSPPLYSLRHNTH